MSSGLKKLFVPLSFVVIALLQTGTSSHAQVSNGDSNRTPYHRHSDDSSTLEKLDKAANLGVRQYRDLKKGEECIEYYSLEDGTVYQQKCMPIRASKHFKSRIDQH